MARVDVRGRDRSVSALAFAVVAGLDRRPWRRQLEPRVLLGLLALLLWGQPLTQAATNDTPALALDDFKISFWNTEGSVKGAFGYNDNVALSHQNPQGSPFWNTAAEFMVFRLPTRGWTFSGFAAFDHAGYLDQSSGVDYAQTGLAMAQLTKDLAADWKLGVGQSYLYQHQILDLSATQTNQFPTTEVRGHAWTGRAFLRYEQQPWWCESEISVSRSWLAQPLDSFWSGGPRLTLGRRLGERGEIRLAAQWSRLGYDTRERVAADGVTETGTDLQLEFHNLDLSWDQTWDAGQHWKTVFRVGASQCRDNGSGFFDYDELQLAAQLKFKAGRWTVTPHGSFSYYHFPIQTISSDDLRLREKMLVSGGLQVERALGKSISVLAAFRHDRSPSNASFDRYAVNSSSLGLQWRY